MENNKKITDEIKNEKEIILSSVLTKLVTLGVLVSIIITDFFLLRLMGNMESDIFLLILILLVLNAIAILRILFTAEAILKGRNLTLKKFLRKESNVDVGSIVKMESFNMTHMKCTLITYTINNKSRNALVFNNNSILVGKESFAGDLINIAQNMPQHT